MRFKVGRVDNKLIRIKEFGRKLGKDKVKKEENDKEDEKVVDSSVGKVLNRGVEKKKKGEKKKDDKDKNKEIIEEWKKVR